MKIKEVCERTGLTDRAVRYYIETGLLTPEYTENYLGRKNYNFSEEDIAELRNILTLRNVGFSVPDISTIQRQPERISELVSVLAERTAAELEKNRSVLDRLSRLELGRIHNISELADALTAAEDDQKNAPTEDKPSWLDISISVCKRVLTAILTWLPIVLAVLGTIVSYRRRLYPEIGCRFPILFLLPSFCMFFTPLLRKSAKVRRRVRAVLLIFCALSLPILQ